MLSLIIRKIHHDLQQIKSVFNAFLSWFQHFFEPITLRVQLIGLSLLEPVQKLLQEIKLFFQVIFDSFLTAVKQIKIWVVVNISSKVRARLAGLTASVQLKAEQLWSNLSKLVSRKPEKPGAKPPSNKEKSQQQRSTLIYSAKKQSGGGGALTQAVSSIRRWPSSLAARIKSSLKKISPPFLIRSYRRFSSKNYSLLASFLATLAILGSAWFIYDLVFKDLPSALDLTEKDQIVTTRILDRNGRLLYRIYKDENRTLVPLENIPQDTINATIAIEDKNFYHHHGFSLSGIFRALIKNIKTDTLQGGSTITQQLVKNRLLNNQKTIKRKMREVLLAILVEGTYTKDEILEMYLNEVAYGGSTYGVEEAAWRYFNKPAKDLTLGESAMLAGLPAAPSIYTPFGSNPELSKRRQKEVLKRMVEEGFITIEEAYHAEQEELDYRQDVIDIKAPHFVMYVKKILAEQYGEEMLQQGGLEVRTTLDLNLQQKAQQILTEELEKLANLNVSNGAALVTNPQTGEILAMVGSRDYFDFEHDGQVNVTVRPRQPGSSIKPLTYSLALENGKTPWTTLKDSPITYQIPGSKPYKPRNYDGKFHGTVTIRQALANSYNVPAVKTLASLGVDRLIDHGQQMGISTWTDRSRFGLSLTLGAGGVLMTDLAQVYGTFANDGYSVEPDPFIEIKDYSGETLYRNICFSDPEQCRVNQPIKPLTAYRITDILADNQARSQAFGRYSVLEIPGHEVAVKTGTSNNLRDNWTIGYIENKLVAVWVGNNDNTAMSQVASGITGASPIWSEIMQLMLNPETPHQFELPEGYVEVKFCPASQTLACPSCPRVTTEIFKQDQQPASACSPVYFQKKEEESSPAGSQGQADRQQIL